MRIGIALPQHGGAATAEGLIAVARRAEALGYDSLWVGDRLLAPVAPKSPYPIGDGTHPLPFRSLLEPVAALTLVAGHTCRVTLGTSVLILPIYHPVVLARQLMTLDVLSHGRLRLGLGVGWNLEEIECVGVAPAERGKRADEAIELMKAIWTQDPAEFHGKYYDMPRSWMGPKPVQKPHPPIYMGAFTPAAMKRIVRYADGWNPVGIPIAAIAGIFGQIQAMAKEAERDPGTLDLVLRANLVITEKPVEGERTEFHGTGEQIAEDIAKARQAGIPEVFFELWTSHPLVDTLEDWLVWTDRLWEISRA